MATRNNFNAGTSSSGYNATPVKEEEQWRMSQHTVAVFNKVRQRTCCPRQDRDAEGGGEERKRLGMEIRADALEQCAGVSQLRMWAAGRCCVFFIYFFMCIGGYRVHWTAV